MSYRLYCNISQSQHIKKSEFICELYRVENMDEVRELIKDARKRHPKATHVCSACRTAGQERSNDDGEPSGTAGVVMLEVLRQKDVIDCLGLVIRYYGGIQLGAGGLIRAYRSSVNDTLNNAQLTQIIQLQEVKLSIPFEVADRILSRIDNHLIHDKNFDQACHLTLHLTDLGLLDQISEWTKGRSIVESVGEIEAEQIIDLT